jgi:thiol-disulfide isomerase/thioredoxin
VAWLVAIGAGAAAVLQIGLVLRLRRQNALLRARVSELEAGGEAAGPGLGLPVGAPAPQFELEDVGGERHPIPSRSGPLLLVFVDARCAPCDLLMPALAESQQRLRIAVIASGDPGRNRAKAAEHALRLVLLQTGREVAEAYRATGTPMAVLIADGRIASPTVAGAKAVAQLAQQAAGAALGRPRELGEAVPRLVLEDLDGEPVALAGGERTLLIFWSPRCEHSQKMVRGLRELAREPLAGAPELVLISDGDAEEVRAQELGWPVLLDPDHRARAAFGARGTPMAVVVDNGRIASPLVAGPAPVFDLLGAVALAAR